MRTVKTNPLWSLRPRRRNIQTLWAVFLVLAAQPVFAQDLSPISTMLETIITALTGPVGQGLVIVALVAAGIAMLIGRLNWMYFVAVLVGAVMIFSAEAIVGGFNA
ncbi:MAG: TrbC/VirB2 family protein, partial [Pseudomonadota bacterium]